MKQLTENEKVLTDTVTSLINEIHNLRIDNAGMRHRLSGFDDVLFILGKRTDTSFISGPNAVEKAIKVLDGIERAYAEKEEVKQTEEQEQSIVDEQLVKWGFVCDSSYIRTDSARWHKEGEIIKHYYFIKTYGPTASTKPWIEAYQIGMVGRVFFAKTVADFKKEIKETFNIDLI